MNRIKNVLTTIKNDIKEDPTTYAVAAIAGITAGVLAVVVLANKDFTVNDCESADGPLHLNMTESIANYMKETGTKASFETPVGNFLLEYQNPTD